MIVNSSTRTPRPNRRRMRLDRFRQPRADVEENILSLDTAKLMYNCAVKNGAIVSSYGIDKATYQTKSGETYQLRCYGLVPTKTWQYHRYDNKTGEWDDRIVMTDDESIIEVYINRSVQEGTSLHTSTVLTFGDAINYHYDDKDVLIIASSLGIYILDDTDLTLVENSPRVVSICKHYERIFGVSGATSPRVWFSAPMQPDNWEVSYDAGGYIDIDHTCGRPYKVVSFLDYVYVFCEYGVYRITAYSNQSEFSMRRILVSSGMIYPDTITVCADKIMFCSEEGVFVFDGVDAYKVMDSYDSLRAKKASFGQGCYYDSKYVVTALLDYGEPLSEGEPHDRYNPNVNSIILYDMRTKEVEIVKGIKVDNLLCFKGRNGAKLYMFNRSPIGIEDMNYCQLDDSGALYGTRLEKKWVSGLTDVGYPDKCKLLRSITLTPKSDTKMFVTLDGDRYRYDLKGGYTRKVPVNRRFDKMSIEFRCYESEMSITSPVIVIDYT